MQTSHRYKGLERVFGWLIPEEWMEKFYFDVIIKKEIIIFEFDFWPIYEPDDFLYFNGCQGYAQFVHKNGTSYLVLAKQESRYMWE